MGGVFQDVTYFMGGSEMCDKMWQREFVKIGQK